jgi:NifB/MoaA-like Fe-S oxidoreductase
MTEEEILRYRSDGIPKEIMFMMSEIFNFAQNMEIKKLAGNYVENDLVVLSGKFDLLQKRIDHYYQKRVDHFGICNLRLKKLSNSIPEIKANLGIL